jgi:hypothetical protein
MEDVSLINLLKTFDLGTWHLAEKFVRSPAHNQREDVIHLFDYLYSKRSSLEERTLDSKKVFAKVFSGQAFDEKKLRYTRSFLYKVMLEMLAWQRFKEQAGQLDQYAAQALQARGLEKEFERSLRDAERQLQQSQFRDAPYYYQQYGLMMERYAYENYKNRQSYTHFKELSDAMTAYFIAERLRQCCTALSHKVISTADLQQDFLPAILADIRQRDYSHIPAIMIYYHSYLALSLPQKLLNPSNGETYWC